MHGVTTSPFYLPKQPIALRRRRAGVRRDNSSLSLLWTHGAVEAAVFRRQVRVRTWKSMTSVTTLPGFEEALDEALGALDFAGADVSLILGHDQFQHRPEQAPAFSESAARAFLKGAVGRMEEQDGPLLWVSQRTQSVRNEASVLLHLLSSPFYDQLNGIMLARRLELTRIVPLVAPLELGIESLPEAQDQPILVAARAGGATVFVAKQAGHPLLFTRCILARWDEDPARIGVEINRSLLYAKQQFGATITRVRLFGDATPEIAAAVTSKCAASTDVSCHPSCGPETWLQAIALSSSRLTVNLVAGYLRYKQRQRLVRRSLIAAAVLGLALSSLEVVQDAQRWAQERTRLAALREAEPTLRAERARLLARNATAARDAQLVTQIEAASVPPVPARFAAFVANTLPSNARLTVISVRIRGDAPGWTVRLEGVIDADEETGREVVAAFERQLARSPFRVRIPDTGRALASVNALPGAAAGETLRFVLEGGLLED